MIILKVILFVIALISSSISFVDLSVYSLNKQFYDVAQTKEKLSVGTLYKEFIISAILWTALFCVCLL